MARSALDSVHARALARARRFGLVAVAAVLASCARGPQEAPPHAVLGKCDASEPARTEADAAAPRETGDEWAPFSDDDDDEERESAAKHGLTAFDPATDYTLDGNTILTMRRTGCLGPCPVYSVGVTGDGAVHFYGNQHTTTVGYATSNIGRAAVQSLLTFLREKHFHALHGHYRPVGPDSADAVLLLRRGTAFKSVRHSLSNDADPALFAIEAEIDRVTGAPHWIGKAKDAARKDATPRAYWALPPNAIRRMAGGQLHKVVRRCSADLSSDVTYDVRLRIDSFGYGLPGSGSISQGSLGEGDWHDRDARMSALSACVDREVSQLVFPIAGVSAESLFPLELAR